MTTFTLHKTIEVTKDEYIAHLEKELTYWEGRKMRLLDEHIKQVSKLKNKQQRELLEFEKIVMDKKKILTKIRA